MNKLVLISRFFFSHFRLLSAFPLAASAHVNLALVGLAWPRPLAAAFASDVLALAKGKRQREPAAAFNVELTTKRGGTRRRRCRSDFLLVFRSERLSDGCRRSSKHARMRVKDGSRHKAAN